MLEFIQRIHGGLARLVLEKRVISPLGLADMQRPILLLSDVSSALLPYSGLAHLMYHYYSGAPEGTPTVFSRLVSADYMQRQCELFFPQEGPFTYASKRGKTAADLNAHTAGWFNTDTTRLLVSNGEFDPWRSASVSSVFRPGGPFEGTPEAPVILIEGSRHCNDLTTRNSVHPPIAAAQQAEIKQISAWVQEFYDGKKIRRSARGMLGRGESV